MTEESEKKVPVGVLLNGQVAVNGVTLHIAMTVNSREDLRRYISETVAPVAEKFGFTVELVEIPKYGDEVEAL